MKIVRVTALWCMSCLAMKRVWRKVFSEYPDIEIVDLDYDEDREEVDKLAVTGTLPVVIIFKDDKELARVAGEKTKKQMVEILEGLNEKD